jgi:uncharacterized Rossmann fold enzyme
MSVRRSILANSAARSARCVGAEFFGDAARDSPQALRAVAERAEAVVVDHRAETDDPRREAVLAVLVVEEAGVRQTWAHDALVAADDRGRVVDLHVGDDQEAVQQLAAAVEQREVLLVLLHGQDQALLRHVEVLGSNSPT